ncbi:MAG: hypothetical protein AAFP19_20545 [Bacteroidota bacterium]
MTTIVEVGTKKQIKQFIDFPHDLYVDDVNYVPELYLAQKEHLNTKKNPFFLHSKVQLYLAMREGKIVGRIAAIRNNNHIQFTNEQVGYFGYFDTINDYEVAKILLDKAMEWVRAEGLEGILGPANFSTNDTAGVLIDGFDRPPTVMMPYNKPYYPEFLERYGLQKQMDLYAYLVTGDKVNMKSVNLAGRLEERINKKGITIRSVNMKHFKEEANLLRDIYNKAWDKNWGFVPATKEEFQALAEGLKLIVDPDFVLIAEHEGKGIGMAVAIPDINQVVRNIPRGRLLPFGIFKLLFGKKNIRKIRIIILGVVEEYRRMGIEGIFYARIIKRGLEKNYTSAEASWILEDNEMMNKGLVNINAEIDKTYRMYQMYFS